MKMTVTGIGSRNKGKKKADGTPYDGQNFYGLKTDAEVEGHKAVEVYFNYLGKVKYPENVKIGDILDIDRNEKGYIAEVTIVKKAQ